MSERYFVQFVLVLQVQVVEEIHDWLLNLPTTRSGVCARVWGPCERGERYLLERKGLALEPLDLGDEVTQ